MYILTIDCGLCRLVLEYVGFKGVKVFHLVNQLQVSDQDLKESVNNTLIQVCALLTCVSDF